jgi:hypothetical protein
MARQCDNCGGTYYRCNTYRGWPTQAPGHREGWVKREIHICHYCQPATLTRRSFIAAESRMLTVREANKLRKQLAPKPRTRQATG